MTKNIFPALVGLTFIFASCSPTKQNTPPTTQTDAIAVTNGVQDTLLTGKMEIPKVIQLEKPVEMTFTVYNRTDRARQFLKWQTPFEPPLSKYLDVFLNGKEDVNYKGAMARRVMPPPAESYITLQPKDSLSVKVDISKSYDLTKPGNYVLKYNSVGMTGINVTDSVSFQLN